MSSLRPKRQLRGAVFCNHCGTRLEVRCQNCDTANPPNSRFCLLCGTPLFVSSGPPAHTGAAEPSSSPYVCPRCQAFNEPGSVYCHSCGLPLDEDRPSLNEAEAGVRPAGFWIRLAACLIDMIVLHAAHPQPGLNAHRLALAGGLDYYSPRRNGPSQRRIWPLLAERPDSALLSRTTRCHG